MKQLEVQIMGQSYLLGCPEGGEARLLDAVERVDTAMCRIRDGNKVRARDRIAVLAALNLAFDLGERAALTIATAPAPLAPEPASPRPQDEADTQMLVSLLDRLDRALGEDGQLI
ncbi:MAG: cell division protein ZapA [Rhodoferax sp.]|jgi:cell division protein ZapA